MLLLLLTGCSTAGNLVRYPGGHSLTYGGTQHLVDVWDSPHDCTGLSRIAVLMDMPCSFALDTALLPLAPRRDPDEPPPREYGEGGRPPR